MKDLWIQDLLVFLSIMIGLRFLVEDDFYYVVSILFCLLIYRM